MIPSSYTPTSFGDTAGTQTVTFSFEGTDITVDVDYDVQSAATGFEVTGTLATQYQNRNVDTTGLSYTYDGVAVDPSDVTVSPATWTASGEGETITFTYDGNDVERTTDVLRTVANLPVIQTATYPIDTAVTEETTWFRNVIPSMNEYFNPNQWGIDFVIDVNGGTYAPMSLNEGDLVWWYQTKADYTNDQANGVTAQDMMAVLTELGMFNGQDPGLENVIYQAYDSTPGAGATCTDFGLIMSLNGAGTAQADTELVYVLGKAKGTVADATTLKPSDVDLLAVWDVTYTAPPATTITDLSVTGTMPAQTIGDYENYSGLDFVVSLSNGQTVHLDWDTDIEPAFSANPILGSHSDWIDTNDWVWQEYQGSDTVTDLQFYIDPSENGAYWASQNVVVSSKVTFNWPTSFQLQTPELTSLSVSGDFTDTQYTGAAPTKTGLTFTASYSNGTSETVSASDITVTPATWDASGNPDNLGEQTATFSYTEDGVTKTATKAVVIHRPSSGQVLDMNQEGWIFFDLTPELKTLCAEGQWGPAALFQGSGADIGHPAFFVFTEDEYENDTPVTAATLGSWMPLYGLGSQGETFQQVGTPNESGFKPGYGVGAYGISDLNDCYVAVRTDGTATMSAGDKTVYLAIGTLANALDGTSYKLSDMSTTGRTVYSAICRKSS